MDFALKESTAVDGAALRQPKSPRLRGDDGNDGAVVVDGDLDLHGTAPGIGSIRLVVDGDLASAQTVSVDADGRWQARLRVDDMVDPAIEHRVVTFDPVDGVTSAARTFRVDLDWTLRADVADPAGDDIGPAGTYVYPADSGWRDNRPADIERVRVWTAGGALRVEITMASLSDVWHPANGFDHVAFTGFLQLSGRAGGTRVMPQQHGDLPDDLRWHLRWRAHGWSNALFSAESASADNEGTPVTPVPDLAIDREARTVTFTLSAAALSNAAPSAALRSAVGDPSESLEGATLYLTTWDYDGGYRPLAPEPGPNTFGGGDPARDPLVMDATTVHLMP